MFSDDAEPRRPQKRKRQDDGPKLLDFEGLRQEVQELAAEVYKLRAAEDECANIKSRHYRAYHDARIPAILRCDQFPRSAWTGRTGN